MVNSEGKPFVVLRGLAEGNVFWSTSKLGDDPTRLVDGTVAYEVIGYCDTDIEAKELYNKRVDPNALQNYIKDTFIKLGYSNGHADQSASDLTKLIEQA